MAVRRNVGVPVGVGFVLRGGLAVGFGDGVAVAVAAGVGVGPGVAVVGSTLLRSALARVEERRR